MERLRVTDSLEVDLDAQRWCCRACGAELADADENYKTGCQVRERDPREVHQPVIEGEYTFAPDPEWCRIVEFYCPDCGLMVENEYLPPGHPITHDMTFDLESLVEKADRAER